MLTVVCWKWQKANGFLHDYTAEHVNILQRMVARWYPHPHRFVCITDDPRGVDCETFPLWDDFKGLRNACGEHLPSCYRRLKLFSDEISSYFGGRIVSLDLDVVITGDLSPLWDREESFIGWKVEGPRHPIVYNGSMFLFQAGKHKDLWTEFKFDVTPVLTKQRGYFGSDQAWISMKFDGKAPYGWTKDDGVYSYPREMRHRPLPRNARVVIFHGKRKPWNPSTNGDGWIREHYR